MILTPLDRGRFVVVHPCSTFSDCRQLSTPLNAEVQKTAKIVFFSPSEGDGRKESRTEGREREVERLYAKFHLNVFIVSASGG